ncbi:sulfatase [Candidatus Neomarinimicrobiota bacterium]
MKRRNFLNRVGVGAAALALPVYAGASLRLITRSGKRPNILLFFPDQLRHDWIEPNPALPLRTPNLEKLGTKGARFTNAVTPSPLCAPARACLASGKEYDRCGVESNDTNYPLDQTTFYTLLRYSGYHVMGCGKFDLSKPDHYWGLDGKRLIGEWGFSDGINSEGKWDGINAYQKGHKPVGPYMAYLQEKGLADVHVTDFNRRRSNRAAVFSTPLSDEDYCDNWIALNGLQLLKNKPEGKPWFLQVNFNGPHSPWDVTESMAGKWRDVDFPQPNGGKSHTPEEYNAIRQNYAAMIENIDRWLGVYLDLLEQRGELDDTLIVFSSDHGEMLGDHDAWSKSKPHQPSAGVPLVIGGPGVEEGIVSAIPMTIIDLAATFLEYGGIEVPADMDSRSLKPYLNGSTQKHRDYVLSGLSSWRMVFDGRYKYVRGYEDQALLFDLVTDPGENINLVDDMQEVSRRLEQILDDEGVGHGYSTGEK